MRLPGHISAWPAVLALCAFGPWQGCGERGLEDIFRPVEGKCGLQGTTVECNADLDCLNSGLGETCLVDGTCSRTDLFCPGHCSEDMICGGDKKCTNPCMSHQDCAPYGQCYCFPINPLRFPPPSPAAWCRYAQCQPGGTCEMDHVPVQGTNLCRPEALEGDCRRSLFSECPEGYEPVGLRGCAVASGT